MRGIRGLWLLVFTLLTLPGHLVSWVRPSLSSSSWLFPFPLSLSPLPKVRSFVGPLSLSSTSLPCSSVGVVGVRRVLVAAQFGSLSPFSGVQCFRLAAFNLPVLLNITLPLRNISFFPSLLTFCLILFTLCSHYLTLLNQHGLI